MKFQVLTHYSGGSVLFTEASDFFSSWRDTPIFGEVKHLCLRAYILTASVSLKPCSFAKDSPYCFLGRSRGHSPTAQLSPVCVMEPRLLQGDLDSDTSWLPSPLLWDRVEAGCGALQNGAADCCRTEELPGSREGVRSPYYLTLTVAWPGQVRR